MILSLCHLEGQHELACGGTWELCNGRPSSNGLIRGTETNNLLLAAENISRPFQEAEYSLPYVQKSVEVSNYSL